MLGRLLVCAVAMGTAMPACAGDRTHPAATGERASNIPPPDTMNLLMQDERTTWGTAPPAPLRIEPGIVLAAHSVAPPADLASFDEMPGAAARYLPVPEGNTPRLILTADEFPSTTVIRLTGPADRQIRWTSSDAVRDAMQPSRRHFRRSPLSGMLVLRIDDEERSPPLSFGGGVASVLNLLPRLQ